MTIGTLNEMLAKTGAGSGVSEGLTADDGATKYGHALVPILNDRLAYDEPYTTDASPHQYRIWLAQVCEFQYSDVSFTQYPSLARARQRSQTCC